MAPGTRASAIRSDQTIDRSTAEITKQIHASAIPMIIQMPPLDRIRSAIGIEESDALPTLEAKTGINEAVGSGDPKLSAEFPARGIVVGIKSR